MTDIALSSFGKPLSMTREAVRKREWRAKSQPSRDAHLSQAGPSRAVRDKSPARQGRVIPFSAGHPSNAGTHNDNQPLNGWDRSHILGPMSQIMSPSLAPDEVRSRALPPEVPKPVPLHGIDWTALTLQALGALALLASLGTNGTYLLAQAQTTRDLIVMGVVALVYDASVAIIPRVGFRFWEGRKFLHSAWTAIIYFVCLIIAAIAAMGFANSNFGDTAAGRGAAANNRATLQAALERAEVDRKKLIVTPTSQIQVDVAEEQKEQSCIPGRKFIQSACDGKRAALAALASNRETELAASRLDTKIADLTEKLSHAPAATSIHPQADGAVMWVGQLSRGTLVLDPKDPLAIQYFGFIFLPMLAGFMFGWAEVLRILRRAG